MSNKLLVIGIIILFCILPARGFSHNDTGSLLSWNVVRADIIYGTFNYQYSNATDMCIGIHFDLLRFGVTWLKYRVGIGASLGEVTFLPSHNIDTPERLSANILPVYVNFLIFEKEWGPSTFPLVQNLNAFVDIGFLPFDESKIITTGIEYTPGALLYVRAGYANIFHSGEREYSLYCSCGLCFGAVNKIR